MVTVQILNTDKVEEENAGKKTKKDDLVVILIDQEQIGAIYLLGKDLGIAPTLEPHVMDNRLDMRLTINRILSSSKSNLKSESTEDNNNKLKSSAKPSQDYLLRRKLFHKNHYYKSLKSHDQEVNDIVNSMQTELDRLLQRKPKNNRKKAKP